eukprot:TRINITY_DN4614_c0_g1_i1.p2 TRINITY_DN4614_c0_g1~~TRINITY_DN4614_c0_g1_i1.p2  ORF type:complete len:380 (+),score=63.70 TRINITY_DN4614_c0_g1_i1:58-1197(+)
MTEKNNMEVPKTTLFHKVAGTGIFIPSIAVTWLGSGAVTFAVQLLIFTVVYPFSPTLFRKINETVVWWWWLIIVWAMEWWSGMDVVISSPNGEFTKAETSVVLGNHAGDVDWMLGWYVASKVNMLQGCKAYMKKLSMVLPILGWSWWLSDYVFLSRDWSKDENTLKKTFETLRSYPFKFWICLFAEGTRKSPSKLAESQKWCRDNKKPVLDHVLWPRTKGFTATMMALEGTVEVVYDMTMAPDPDYPPSFGKMLRGQFSRCYLNVKTIRDIPKTEEGLKALCEQVFVDKNADLEYMKQHRTFPYPIIKEGLGKRWVSRASMYFWTTVIQGTIIYLLLTSDSAFVRNGIVALHVILGLGLMGLMHYAAGNKPAGSKAKAE